MDLDLATISRRGLLQFGAASVAGLALGQNHAFSQDTPANEIYSGLPMSLQTYSLRDRSFEKALDAIKNDLKLTHVEVWNGHLTGISPAKVKTLLTDHGLTAIGYGVINFTKDADANRKQFEAAKEFGAPHITCNPTPDSLDNLDKLTEEFGITADIHDPGPGSQWSTVDAIWKAIKDHSKMIGLCNDTGNFIKAGEDPLRALDLFGDRIHAFHVKDYAKDDNGHLKDCPLGEGVLKLDVLTKWLLAKKFRGDLSLEYLAGNPVEGCKAELALIAKAVAAANA